MVRIHVGQPILLGKLTLLASATQKRHRKRPIPKRRTCDSQNASDTGAKSSPPSTPSPRAIEISKTKSKTRSRRLVTICPALAGWMEPYRACSGLIWQKSLCLFHDEFGALRDSVKIPARRNGLRHGFVSFHFALNANENLTAAEAGNSPGMVHKNYKGLATKADA